MKHNYRKLAILLPVLPMLMATTALPPRYCYSKEGYKDFESAFIEAEIVQDRCVYNYHFKNTGEGYIDVFSITGHHQYLSQTICHGSSCEQTYSMSETTIAVPVSNDVFESYVLGPNQEIDIAFNAPIYSGNYKLDASAYAEFDENVTVFGEFLVNHNQYSEKHYYSIRGIRLEDTDDKNYNYGVIVKAVIEGETFYFEANQEDAFSFTTTKELKQSEIASLEIVKVVRSEYKEPANVVGIVLLSFILIPILATIVFVAGIVTLVVLLSKHSKKKNNR